MPLGAMLLVAAVGSSATPCYADEPTTITVSGTLTEETFAGPPNYKSIAEGDEPERMFVLLFNSHICTTGSKDPDSTDVPHADVDKTQLVFLDDAWNMYKVLRPYLGKQVQCTGQLFDSLTGGQFTPVLLKVSGKNCRPVKIKIKNEGALHIRY